MRKLSSRGAQKVQGNANSCKNAEPPCLFACFSAKNPLCLVTEGMGFCSGCDQLVDQSPTCLVVEQKLTDYGALGRLRASLCPIKVTGAVVRKRQHHGMRDVLLYQVNRYRLGQREVLRCGMHMRREGQRVDAVKNLCQKLLLLIGRCADHWQRTQQLYLGIGCQRYRRRGVVFALTGCQQVAKTDHDYAYTTIDFNHHCSFLE